MNHEEKTIRHRIQLDESDLYDLLSSGKVEGEDVVIGITPPEKMSAVIRWGKTLKVPNEQD